MITIAVKTTGMAVGVKLNVSSTNRYFRQLQRVILSAGKSAARTTLMASSRSFRDKLKRSQYQVAPLSNRWIIAKQYGRHTEKPLMMTKTYVNSWRVRNTVGFHRTIYSKVYAAYTCYPVGTATETVVRGSRIVSLRMGPMTNQIKGLILEGLIPGGFQNQKARPHRIHLQKLILPILPRVFQAALKLAVARSMKGLSLAPNKVSSMLANITP